MREERMGRMGRGKEGFCKSRESFAGYFLSLEEMLGNRIRRERTNCGIHPRIRSVLDEQIKVRG